MAARQVDLVLGLAIAMFCGALAAAQESVEPVLQRAMALHQAGRVEQAIPEYRAYLKVRPDNVDARHDPLRPPARA